MTTTNTIVRVIKKNDPYVRIDKQFINNPDLSLKAKGLLTYLLSKPDNWQAMIADIMKNSRDQETAVRSALNELIANKYAIRIRFISSRGKIVSWSYRIYERPHNLGEVTQQDIKLKGDYPDGENPHVDNPQVDNPHVENQALLTNDVNKSRTIKTNEKNNNNSAAAADLKREGRRAVVVEPIKQKRKWIKYQKKINNLGWLGSLEFILNAWNENPRLVTAWVDVIEKQQGAHNPAGLLRKMISTGKMPASKEGQKLDYRKYTDDKYAEFIQE